MSKEDADSHPVSPSCPFDVNKLDSLIMILIEKAKNINSGSTFSDSIDKLIDEYFLNVPSTCTIYNQSIPKVCTLIKIILKRTILEFSDLEPTRDTNVYDTIRLISSLRRSELVDSREIISLLLIWLENQNCTERTGLSILRLFVDWHKYLFSKISLESNSDTFSLTQLLMPFFSFVKNLFSCINLSMVATSNSHLALNSLKIASECPLIIVVLFQIHKKLVADLFVSGSFLTPFSDCVRAFIRDTALNSGKTISFELISVYVKILSLLTFMARAIPMSMKFFAPLFPTFILSLSQLVSEDSFGLRREILIALRHLILTPDVRPHIAAKVTEFLSSSSKFFNFSYEIIDLSYHRTGRSFLPMMVTTFADFIVQLRTEIPYSTFVDNVIPTFIKFLEDERMLHNSIPLGIKAVSARLLCTIMEHIVLGLPLASHPQITIPMRKEIFWRVFCSFCRGIRIFLQLKNLPFDESTYDSSRTFFKAVLTGLKVVFFTFRSLQSSPQPISSALFSIRGIVHKEALWFVRLFGDLISALKIILSDSECKESISEGKQSTMEILHSGQQSEANTSFSLSLEMISFYSSGLVYDNLILQGHLSNEIKELVDLIAQLFILLEVPIFSDSIASNCQEMYTAIDEVPAIAALLQAFLLGPGGPECSKITLTHLLRWLCKNIFNNLTKIKIRSAAILHRVVRLSLMALGTYPEELESIYATFLPEIILACLRSGTSKIAIEPIHSFLLLKTIFRAIGGGRFELLYKEIIPILPSILECLNGLLATLELLDQNKKVFHPHPSQILKDLIVELALTIPVRLSVLLPYLSLLMKPLVYSLKTSAAAPNTNQPSSMTGTSQRELNTTVLPQQPASTNPIPNQAPMPGYNNTPPQNTIYSAASSAPDLLSQGLRTLELCIDNLTQDFLDPILSSVMPELLEALWTHCKPLPYPSQFSHTALRILGKMAGRNKRQMRLPKYQTVPYVFNISSKCLLEAFGKRLIELWNVLLSCPTSQILELTKSDLRPNLNSSFLEELSKTPALDGSYESDKFEKLDGIASISIYLPKITFSCLEKKDILNDVDKFALQMRYFAYFTYFGFAYKSGKEIPPLSAIKKSLQRKILDVLSAEGDFFHFSLFNCNYAMNIVSPKINATLETCSRLNTEDSHETDGTHNINDVHANISNNARYTFTREKEKFCTNDIFIKKKDHEKTTNVNETIPNIPTSLTSNGDILEILFSECLSSEHPQLRTVTSLLLIEVVQLLNSPKVISFLINRCLLLSLDQSIYARISACDLLKFIFSIPKSNISPKNSLNHCKIIEDDVDLRFARPSSFINPNDVTTAFIAPNYQENSINFSLEIFSDDELAFCFECLFKVLGMSQQSSIGIVSLQIPGEDVLIAFWNFFLKSQKSPTQLEVLCFILIKELSSPLEQNRLVAQSFLEKLADELLKLSNKELDILLSEKKAHNQDIDLENTKCSSATLLDSEKRIATNVSLTPLNIVTPLSVPVSSTKPDSLAAVSSSNPSTLNAPSGMIPTPQGKIISRLLEPYRFSVIENDWLQKRVLSGIPIGHQIGIIEAIAFILKKDASFLGLGPFLLSLVSECVALADLDDQPSLAVVSSGTTTQSSGASQNIGNVPLSSTPQMSSFPATGGNHNSPHLSNTSSGSFNSGVGHPVTCMPTSSIHQPLLTAGVIKNSTSPLVSRLRVACIRLLTGAMGCSEFLTTTSHLPLRNRIVSIFFKSLYARNGDIVSASKTGLALVISLQHKLPKELMQHGLRPVLMNLSDYKRLTVLGLEGLGRLLELLTSYFKAEIGRKLLEHLKQWADAAALSTSPEMAPEIGIISAILDVFHLLPPTSSVFLEETILTLASLEEMLKSTKSSPFRNPVLKYLCKYPAETIQVIIHPSKLADDRIISLFCDLVCYRADVVLLLTSVECWRVLLRSLSSYSHQTASEYDQTSAPESNLDSKTDSNLGLNKQSGIVADFQLDPMVSMHSGSVISTTNPDDGVAPFERKGTETTSVILMKEPNLKNTINTDKNSQTDSSTVNLDSSGGKNELITEKIDRSMESSQSPTEKNEHVLSIEQMSNFLEVISSMLFSFSSFLIEQNRKEIRVDSILIKTFYEFLILVIEKRKQNFTFRSSKPLRFGEVFSYSFSNVISLVGESVLQQLAPTSTEYQSLLKMLLYATDDSDRSFLLPFVKNLSMLRQIFLDPSYPLTKQLDLAIDGARLSFTGSACLFIGTWIDKYITTTTSLSSDEENDLLDLVRIVLSVDQVDLTANNVNNTRSDTDLKKLFYLSGEYKSRRSSLALSLARLSLRLESRSLKDVLYSTLTYRLQDTEEDLLADIALLVLLTQRDDLPLLEEKVDSMDMGIISDGTKDKVSPTVKDKEHSHGRGRPRIHPIAKNKEHTLRKRYTIAKGSEFGDVDSSEFLALFYRILMESSNSDVRMLLLDTFSFLFTYNPSIIKLYLKTLIMKGPVFSSSAHSSGITDSTLLVSQHGLFWSALSRQQPSLDQLPSHHSNHLHGRLPTLSEKNNNRFLSRVTELFSSCKLPGWWWSCTLDAVNSLVINNALNSTSSSSPSSSIISQQEPKNFIFELKSSQLLVIEFIFYVFYLERGEVVTTNGCTIDSLSKSFDTSDSSLSSTRSQSDIGPYHPYNSDTVNPNPDIQMISASTTIASHRKTSYHTRKRAKVTSISTSLPSDPNMLIQDSSSVPIDTPFAIPTLSDAPYHNINLVVDMVVVDAACASLVRILIHSELNFPKLASYDFQKHNNVHDHTFYQYYHYYRALFLLTQALKNNISLPWHLFEDLFSSFLFDSRYLSVGSSGVQGNNIIMDQQQMPSNVQPPTTSSNEASSTNSPSNTSGMLPRPIRSILIAINLLFLFLQSTDALNGRWKIIRSIPSLFPKFYFSIGSISFINALGGSVGSPPVVAISPIVAAAFSLKISTLLVQLLSDDLIAIILSRHMSNLPSDIQSGSYSGGIHIGNLGSSIINQGPQSASFFMGNEMATTPPSLPQLIPVLVMMNALSMFSKDIRKERVWKLSMLSISSVINILSDLTRDAIITIQNELVSSLNNQQHPSTSDLFMAESLLIDDDIFSFLCNTFHQRKSILPDLKSRGRLNHILAIDDHHLAYLKIYGTSSPISVIRGICITLALSIINAHTRISRKIPFTSDCFSQVINQVTDTDSEMKSMLHSSSLQDDPGYNVDNKYSETANSAIRYSTTNLDQNDDNDDGTSSLSSSFSYLLPLSVEEKQTLMGAISLLCAHPGLFPMMVAEEVIQRIVSWVSTCEGNLETGLFLLKEKMDLIFMAAAMYAKLRETIESGNYNSLSTIDVPISDCRESDNNDRQHHNHIRFIFQSPSARLALVSSINRSHQSSSQIKNTKCSKHTNKDKSSDGTKSCLHNDVANLTESSINAHRLSSLTKLDGIPGSSFTLEDRITYNPNCCDFEIIRDLLEKTANRKSFRVLRSGMRSLKQAMVLLMKVVYSDYNPNDATSDGHGGISNDASGYPFGQTHFSHTEITFQMQKDFLSLLVECRMEPLLYNELLHILIRPILMNVPKISPPNSTVSSHNSIMMEPGRKTLSDDIFVILRYVLGVQSWESLSISYWIHEAFALMLIPLNNYFDKKSFRISNSTFHDNAKSYHTSAFGLCSACHKSHKSRINAKDGHSDGVDCSCSNRICSSHIFSNGQHNERLNGCYCNIFEMEKFLGSFIIEEIVSLARADAWWAHTCWIVLFPIVLEIIKKDSFSNEGHYFTMLHPQPSNELANLSSNHGSDNISLARSETWSTRLPRHTSGDLGMVQNLASNRSIPFLERIGADLMFNLSRPYHLNTGSGSCLSTLSSNYGGCLSTLCLNYGSSSSLVNVPNTKMMGCSDHWGKRAECTFSPITNADGGDIMPLSPAGTILEGLARLVLYKVDLFKELKLKGSLLRYLAKNFGYFTSLVQAEAIDQFVVAEISQEMGEQDVAFGAYRTEAIFPQTILALSLEQAGYYEGAQVVLENAQAAARAGRLASLPLTDEYVIEEGDTVNDIDHCSRPASCTLSTSKSKTNTKTRAVFSGNDGGESDINTFQQENDGDAFTDENESSDYISGLHYHSHSSSLTDTHDELALWQTHWINAAKRLQQWDLLVELAKVDNDIDLSLDASWRLLDWTTVKDQTAIRSALELVMDSPTPKRLLYDALLNLHSIITNAYNGNGNNRKITELGRIIEEGFQVCLAQWAALPNPFLLGGDTSEAHSRLLQSMQLLVEVQEAVPLFIASAPGAPPFPPSMVPELRGILSTWRERLPSADNDTLDSWSDLAAWRQSVFSAINNLFSGIETQDVIMASGSGGVNPSSSSNITISSGAPGTSSGVPSGSFTGTSSSNQHSHTTPPIIMGSSASFQTTGSSFQGPISTGGTGGHNNLHHQHLHHGSLLYRGYHESAWLINRFATVARKHSLPDICVQLLNKIYTLPNIEIQDAFWKLNEQAQCYLDAFKDTLSAPWLCATIPLHVSSGGLASGGGGTFGGNHHRQSPVTSQSTGIGGVIQSSSVAHESIPSSDNANTTISGLSQNLHRETGHYLLVAGLEIINSTNLAYFSNNQKAEFFSLKGKFLEVLQITGEECNKVHSQAVQLDINHGQAWAAWGDYNRRRFYDTVRITMAPSHYYDCADTIDGKNSGFNDVSMEDSHTGMSILDGEGTTYPIQEQGSSISGAKNDISNNDLVTHSNNLTTSAGLQKDLFTQSTLHRETSLSLDTEEPILSSPTAFGISSSMPPLKTPQIPQNASIPQQSSQNIVVTETNTHSTTQALTFAMHAVHCYLQALMLGVASSNQQQSTGRYHQTGSGNSGSLSTGGGGHSNRERKSFRDIPDDKENSILHTSNHTFSLDGLGVSSSSSSTSPKEYKGYLIASKILKLLTYQQHLSSKQECDNSSLVKAMDPYLGEVPIVPWLPFIEEMVDAISDMATSTVHKTHTSPSHVCELLEPSQYSGISDSSSGSHLTTTVFSEDDICIGEELASRMRMLLGRIARPFPYFLYYVAASKKKTILINILRGMYPLVVETMTLFATEIQCLFSQSTAYNSNNECYQHIDGTTNDNRDNECHYQTDTFQWNDTTFNQKKNITVPRKESLSYVVVGSISRWLASFSQMRTEDLELPGQRFHISAVLSNSGIIIPSSASSLSSSASSNENMKKKPQTSNISQSDQMITGHFPTPSTAQGSICSFLKIDSFGMIMKNNMLLVHLTDGTTRTLSMVPVALSGQGNILSHNVCLPVNKNCSPTSDKIGLITHQHTPAADQQISIANLGQGKNSQNLLGEADAARLLWLLSGPASSGQLVRQLSSALLGWSGALLPLLASEPLPSSHSLAFRLMISFPQSTRNIFTFEEIAHSDSQSCSPLDSSRACCYDGADNSDYYNYYTNTCSTKCQESSCDDGNHSCKCVFRNKKINKKLQPRNIIQNALNSEGNQNISNSSRGIPTILEFEKFLMPKRQILGRFLASRLAGAQEYWVFRKSLALQWASLTLAWSILGSIDQRHLSTIHLSLETGRLTWHGSAFFENLLNLHEPNLENSGRNTPMKANHHHHRPIPSTFYQGASSTTDVLHVPLVFRMGLALQSYFGQMMIDGVFVPSIHALSSALSRKSDEVSSLFDLLAFGLTFSNANPLSLPTSNPTISSHTDSRLIDVQSSSTANNSNNPLLSTHALCALARISYLACEQEKIIIAKYVSSYVSGIISQYSPDSEIDLVKGQSGNYSEESENLPVSLYSPIIAIISLVGKLENVVDLPSCWHAWF